MGNNITSPLNGSAVNGSCKGVVDNERDAVLVGDSEVDLEAAANAGIPCISVSWGFKGRDFLEEHKAEIIVDMPKEILAYV